jgi:hypothetical protein
MRSRLDSLRPEFTIAKLPLAKELEDFQFEGPSSKAPELDRSRNLPRTVANWPVMPAK